MADIEIRCSSCDAILEGEFKKYGTYSAALLVEPCNDCMKQSYSNGEESGRETGIAEGRDLERAEAEKEKGDKQP
jgi:hypothetical protein